LSRQKIIFWDRPVKLERTSTALPGSKARSNRIKKSSQSGISENASVHQNPQESLHLINSIVRRGRDPWKYMTPKIAFITFGYLRHGQSLTSPFLRVPAKTRSPIAYKCRC